MGPTIMSDLLKRHVDFTAADLVAPYDIPDAGHAP